MALTKAQKNKILEELREKIDRQKSIVFCDFTGLKVKDLSALRKIMKKQNCELKVAKKTLIFLTLKEKNIQIDLTKLRGEVALGLGYNDEVSPFKIVHNFARSKENLKILGGLVGGEFYDQAQAVVFAQLPSKEEIIFGIFNSLQRNLSILKVRG